MTEYQQETLKLQRLQQAQQARAQRSHGSCAHGRRVVCVQRSALHQRQKPRLPCRHSVRQLTEEANKSKATSCVRGHMREGAPNLAHPQGACSYQFPGCPHLPQCLIPQCTILAACSKPVGDSMGLRSAGLVRVVDRCQQLPQQLTRFQGCNERRLRCSTCTGAGQEWRAARCTSVSSSGSSHMHSAQCSCSGMASARPGAGCCSSRTAPAACKHSSAAL